MYCKGHETRVKIVQKYNINCVAHIRLLEGQTIKSDAEHIIKDSYYVFLCKSKTGDGKEEKIVCGSRAARDLLNLAGIKAPSIFNMIHESNIGKTSVSKQKAINHVDEWNPAERQLYNAIMILITAWNLKPGPIYDYLEETFKYKKCKPYAFRVKRINEILRRHNTSLREVIRKVERNNQIRKYEFDLLEDILHEDGEKSYFEDVNGR